MKAQLASICALALSASVAQARIGQRFEVEAGGISFYIDYNDSGSSNPYSVIFRKDGVRSKYRLRAADGFVRKINVGDLRYSAVYKSNGSLRRVNDLNDRRALFGLDADEKDEVDEADMIHPARRLALLTCDDCETVWSLICNGGMDTLCDEIEYGEAPLVDQPDVEESIYTMCYTLRPKCDDYTPDETCDGQCEECDRALTFSLEWSNRDADMDLRIVEPDGTRIRWNNRDGSVGYLDQDSLSAGPEIYRVYNGLSTTSDEVLGTYKAAARLVNNRGDEPVSWKLTAEMDGVTVFTESGEFDENGTQTDFFEYDLSTYIDNGCDNEVLASIIGGESNDDGEDIKEGSP